MKNKIIIIYLFIINIQKKLVNRKYKNNRKLINQNESNIKDLYRNKNLIKLRNWVNKKPDSTYHYMIGNRWAKKKCINEWITKIDGQIYTYKEQKWARKINGEWESKINDKKVILKDGKWKAFINNKWQEYVRSFWATKENGKWVSLINGHKGTYNGKTHYWEAIINSKKAVFKGDWSFFIGGCYPYIKNNVKTCLIDNRVATYRNNEWQLEMNKQWLSLHPENKKWKYRVNGHDYYWLNHHYAYIDSRNGNWFIYKNGEWEKIN